MKVGTRLPSYVVAAVLVGSIALLAMLQYRWLGQVSAAERERMKTNLAARASGFAQDFDREITRAHLTFQLEPVRQQANIARLVSERFDRWQATSRYPRLIEDVYVASRVADGETKLQQFNSTTRYVEPAEWPERLAAIRDALAAPAPFDSAAPRLGQGGPTNTVGAAESERPTILVRTMPKTVWESIPALVVPAPVMILATRGALPLTRGVLPDLKSQPMSFVVLVLDREYISNEMLPALAQQHFRGAGEGIDYDVAVVNLQGKTPVFSTASSFTPDPAAPSDATADLFRVRPQEFGELVSEVRRFTSFVSTLVDKPGKAGPSTGSAKGRISIREAPFSVTVEHSPSDRREVETAFAAAAAARPAAAAPSWRLVVKHPSGSLEAAVAQVRTRNLLVSSGILAILGVSLGFLVVTTRRAQALARQQMEFVAAVSHELRTPLAVIRSAADNLADGVVSDDTQVKKYGDLVRGEGRRLSEMVEQILELAGIHSGQRGFVLAPVAVLPLLHEIVSASSTLIEEARLTVEYDVPDSLPPVLGDEPALRRLFQNLLGNAIKYGASGGWIGLRARSTGREVVVTVADHGRGIDASEQAKIFEPFYRAPSAIAAQVQGAGLGLSLVQRIVEAHGGRITVRSTPGAGSEFIVQLPSASEEGAARTSPVVDPARTSA